MTISGKLIEDQIEHSDQKSLEEGKITVCFCFTFLFLNCLVFYLYFGVQKRGHRLWFCFLQIIIQHSME